MTLRRLIYESLAQSKLEAELEAKQVRLKQLADEAEAEAIERRSLNSVIEFEALITKPSQRPENLPDAGGVDNSGKPDDKKEFNLRQAALIRWMTSKGLEPCIDMPVKLKHYSEFKGYTKKTLYAELCRFDNVFLMAETTFNDFWQEQKLLKFK